MPASLSKPCTAFEGTGRLSSGPLIAVVLAVKEALDSGTLKPLLVFDDSTGQVLDFDLRGSTAEVIARLSGPAAPAGTPLTAPQARGGASDGPRGKGRPKLGVIAREVTLLPRHWEWLTAQPGGASATLRRLVDDARRAGSPNLDRRAMQETAYRFMSAMAGDLAGFEEAARALFADDRPRMEQHMAGWPGDVRQYVLRLAWGDRVTPSGT